MTKQAIVDLIDALQGIGMDTLDDLKVIIERKQEQPQKTPLFPKSTRKVFKIKPGRHTTKTRIATSSSADLGHTLQEFMNGHGITAKKLAKQTKQLIPVSVLKTWLSNNGQPTVERLEILNKAIAELTNPSKKLIYNRGKLDWEIVNADS